MPVNRFEKLKNIIHFADNSAADKLFKIRPLINKINEQLNCIPIEESLVIDEQIIPLKEIQSNNTTLNNLYLKKKNQRKSALKINKCKLVTDK